MTYSTLGSDGQLIEQLDSYSGKKKFVFIPTRDTTGKEVPVHLPQASRRQGLYIIGATGTGKSGLITNLVLQDIKQGKGVAVLDPHTDLTNSILAQLPAIHVVNGVKRNTEEDVILLDALDKTHIFGLNLYQCDDPTNDELVQETYERVAHIFEVLWLNEDRESAFGPQITEGLLYSTYTLIYNASTQFAGCGMLEIPLLFRNDTARANMVAHIQNSTIRSYWEDEFNTFDRNEKARRAGMIINKINEFITNPIFRRIVGQSRTTIDFSEAMNNGKIVLVKLPGKFEKMTEILGAMIIAQILAASYAREKQQKRRQFNIYADEFQRFATPDFAKLLTEASRKYNTPVTIAHQARDFLDLRNQAASLQVANVIVLRILYKDAQEVTGSFNITPQAAWDEELEEEWVEVIKPEWHERIEEEVTDGEDTVVTYKRDVVGHLLYQGNENPAVEEFVKKYLVRLDNTSKENATSRDGLIGTQYGENTEDKIGEDVLRWIFGGLWGLNEKPSGELRELMGLDKKNPLAAYKIDREAYRWKYDNYGSYWYDPIVVRDDLRKLNYFLFDAMRGKISDAEAYLLTSGILQPPGQWGMSAFLGFDTYYYINFGEISDETREAYFQIMSFIKKISDDTHLQQIARTSWRTEGDEIRRRCRREIIPCLLPLFRDKHAPEMNLKPYVYDAEKDRYKWFVTSLLATIEVLQQHPIQTGESGQYKARTRKQITYLTHPAQTITHPRVAITHPQRPYQDVLNEVATELANLPNYIARIRITNDAEELVEHTIKTLKPEQGLGESGLEKRIARIKQNMRNLGYYRAKAEVDEEIRKRHERLRLAQGLPVTKPQQQQPHYARQVPVQGRCPSCNATNPRSAQFCNHCGAKLTT